MRDLREFTPARVALGRVGNGLPTQAHLAFQLAHARARDAVHERLDAAALAMELHERGFDCIRVASAAPDRATFLRRPDLGRVLNEASRESVARHRGDYEAVFAIADGLSALALDRHAAALVDAVAPRLAGWKLAPLVIVEQGRVAVGDDIASRIGAAMAVVLIGERPGLGSPDSLGVYITWAAAPGRTDAERNCISNIRAEGLSYALAAHKLAFLMNEARRRKLTGVGLKEEAGLLS